MRRAILPLCLILGWGWLLGPLPLGAAQPAERHVRLEARSFTFTPAVIRVRQGDRVTLDLEAMDVTHGVYLDGYGVQAVAEPGRSATVTFRADRAGKFRYRCSVACGAMHPFMIGEHRRFVLLFLWNQQNRMLAFLQVRCTHLYHIPPWHTRNVINHALDSEVARALCLSISSVGWMVGNGNVGETFLKLRPDEVLLYYATRSAFRPRKNDAYPCRWRVFSVKG